MGQSDPRAGREAAGREPPPSGGRDGRTRAARAANRQAAPEAALGARPLGRGSVTPLHSTPVRLHQRGTPQCKGDAEILARVPRMATSGSTRPARRGAPAAQQRADLTAALSRLKDHRKDAVKPFAARADSVTRNKSPTPQLWTVETRYRKTKPHRCGSSTCQRRAAGNFPPATSSRCSHGQPGDSSALSELQQHVSDTGNELKPDPILLKPFPLRCSNCK